MGKQVEETKNYTFQTSDGGMVCIEAKSKQEAQKRFDKLYKAK